MEMNISSETADQELGDHEDVPPPLEDGNHQGTETDQNFAAENHDPSWFGEFSIKDAPLSWCILVNRTLSRETSESEDISLLETGLFGKILAVNGKLMSAERDEFIYHEYLVHPALLFHNNPRSVFIMGGAEGSTAREVLKHKSIEKVVLCVFTSDKKVLDFCRTHLTENQETFRNQKLQVVFNDPKNELEKSEEKYDVIVGDLADPFDGVAWFMLYTDYFYKKILKPKLNPNGIFVTQAGPAGVLSHGGVFTCVCNTLKSCFQYMYPMKAHVPSRADEVGWVLAFDNPVVPLDGNQLHSRISERIEGGNLRYLDGDTITASSISNYKILLSGIRDNIMSMFSEEKAKLMFGEEVGTT